MKLLYSLIAASFIVIVSAQSEASLVVSLEDERYMLSNDGASYFAKLSLDCTNKPAPHYFYRALRLPGEEKGPKDYWPSFYGCYDWHSAVHNHWAMVKLLKLYPTIPEANALNDKLELSFNAENIKEELAYLKSHEDGFFEFPYGQSWLLKVADELIKWDDPRAKRWLNNLKPLTEYIVSVHLNVWPPLKSVNLSGSHDSPAMGLSFAYDYAVSSKNKKLKEIVSQAAIRFYGDIANAPLNEEPFDYDFMSAGLLVTDLMRKVLAPKEYVSWLKSFSPELFIAGKVNIPLKLDRVDKHDGYEAHWDGFHLNRIWCLNGILKTLPADALSKEAKSEWVSAMNGMWDYAQESIGKGNYDIDHWLSTFSVFALIGYE
jgi:hypothetical protein